MQNAVLSCLRGCCLILSKGKAVYHETRWKPTPAILDWSTFRGDANEQGLSSNTPTLAHSQNRVFFQQNRVTQLQVRCSHSRVNYLV
jgi:hypothetical protein